MVDEISSCESWRDLLEILEDEAGPAGSGLTLFVGVKVYMHAAYGSTAQTTSHALMCAPMRQHPPTPQHTHMHPHAPLRAPLVMPLSPQLPHLHVTPLCSACLCHAHVGTWALVRVGCALVPMFVLWAHSSALTLRSCSCGSPFAALPAVTGSPSALHLPCSICTLLQPPPPPRRPSAAWPASAVACLPPKRRRSVQSPVSTRLCGACWPACRA